MMDTRRVTTILAAGAVALLTALPCTGRAEAGAAPDRAICEDSARLAETDAVTQGGCIAIHRRKGYCNACHEIAGAPSGDVAPALAFVAKRYPSRAALRAQIEDARRSRPDTIMPPFGAHRILTPDEIDKVVEFLLTL